MQGDSKSYDNTVEEAENQLILIVSISSGVFLIIICCVTYCICRQKSYNDKVAMVEKFELEEDNQLNVIDYTDDKSGSKKKLKPKSKPSQIDEEEQVTEFI